MLPRERYLRRREALLVRLAKAREAEEEAGVDLPRELGEGLAERWPELAVVGRRRIVAAVLERVDVAKANGHGPHRPPARAAGLAWVVGQFEPSRP